MDVLWGRALGSGLQNSQLVWLVQSLPMWPGLPQHMHVSVSNISWIVLYQCFGISMRMLYSVSAQRCLLIVSWETW